MRPTLPFPAWLIGLALALAAPVEAQEHTHPASLTEADPFVRVMLEGPHIVLAHHGFIVLTASQLDALHAARSRLCAAQTAYVHDVGVARTELGKVLADGDDAGVGAVAERLARAKAEWLVALVRARGETMAPLGLAERAQVVQLGDHWAREASAMIAATTHPGHRGHPGLQVPIRVPGMVVADTTLVPFCESLHGPAVHLSIPPPGDE
jgi:hypothetical protein